MSDVQHISLPLVSAFVGDRILATTPKAVAKPEFGGGTAVIDTERKLADMAWWGTNNLFPQDVICDISKTSLIASVLERKVDMLVSGGVGYGTVIYDPTTGQQRIQPLSDQRIDDWMEDTNASLYVHEATRDWYTYYNIFPELRMGKGKDRIVGIECKDASQVRLSTMDDRGKIPLAFLGDFRDGINTVPDAKIDALDPYFRVHDQVLNGRKARYILPTRILDRGQFYYGIAPWNGLRCSGWLDVAKRIPTLKMHLLKNLMHMRYHFEFAPEYWPTKYLDWEKKGEAAQLAIQIDEVSKFNAWAKGGDGQGGSFWSSMFRLNSDKPLESLIKINEMKMALPDGAYLQDSQEADFIICRDLGLKPSLHGISPSKSGSSPGSGSEDRIARTNHILDQKLHADKVLSVFQLAARVNGWPRGIRFYFQNYYAATLDRTMQVGDLNKDKAA